MSLRTLLLTTILSLSLFSLSSTKVELISMSLLDGRILLKVPKSFDIMTEELMRVKYPTERRPTLVYSDDSGAINVALNLTPNPANQEMIDPYFDNFKMTFENLYPSAEWKGAGVQEINGRKVGYLKLITPAIDTEIYNQIFFTDLDGQLLLCTFNCTVERLDDWEVAAEEIMQSLKLKDKK